MHVRKGGADSISIDIIFVGTLFFCMIPADAQASGMAIFYIAYWVVGFSQLLPLLLLCSRRMQGRCVPASLAYLGIVATLWNYVVLALPQDLVLKFSEAEWFSRTIYRKREYLLEKFGPDYGKTLFDVLTFYVPLLLPPMLAWGIYLLLRRKVSHRPVQ
jgi:hypothetical protein